MRLTVLLSITITCCGGVRHLVRGVVVVAGSVVGTIEIWLGEGSLLCRKIAESGQFVSGLRIVFVRRLLRVTAAAE
jgi:hypothetical protein